MSKSESRSDRIYRVLSESESGRLKVSEVRNRLAHLEDAPDLKVSVVSATARVDNRTKRSSGKGVRFNVYGDGGEEFGYISTTPDVGAANSAKRIVDDYLEQTPVIIQRANDKVRRKLKKQISDLTWQEFEDNFLVSILEALGFSEVSLTQRTHDGGSDAYCSYKRGIIESEAIVSAKHWKGRNKVPDQEVDRVRGIPHQADTAVIVTSSDFTKPAQEKARSQPGWRSVVLVNGDLIVETCMRNSIGVEEVILPSLYRNTDLKEDIELAPISE